MVGALLVLMYQKLFPLFEKFWKIAALAFPFILLLGFLLPGSSFWAWYVVFLTLGVAAGLISDEKKHLRMEKSLVIGAWQACSVIGGLCLLFAARQFLPQFAFLWNFGEGYWLSFLGAWVVQK